MLNHQTESLFEACGMAAGNTCFINAALQCLRASPGLLQTLVPDLAAETAWGQRLVAASPGPISMPGMDSGDAMASGSLPQAGRSTMQPLQVAPGGLLATPSSRVRCSCLSP